MGGLLPGEYTHSGQQSPLMSLTRHRDSPPISSSSRGLARHGPAWVIRLNKKVITLFCKFV